MPMPRRPLSPKTIESDSIPEPNTGCWLYLGGLDGFGYGQHRINGRPGRAHRASWIAHHGHVPPGMFVLHRCDVPCCVNPTHLFLGTQLDNMRDMQHKRRDRKARGDDHYKAVLTDEQVEEIRGSRARGVDLASRFGISQSLVSLIRSGHKRRNQQEPQP